MQIHSQSKLKLSGIWVNTMHDNFYTLFSCIWQVLGKRLLLGSINIHPHDIQQGAIFITIKETEKRKVSKEFYMTL